MGTVARRGRTTVDFMRLPQGRVGGRLIACICMLTTQAVHVLTSYLGGGVEETPIWCFILGNRYKQHSRVAFSPEVPPFIQVPVKLRNAGPSRRAVLRFCRF